MKAWVSRFYALFICTSIISLNACTTPQQTRPHPHYVKNIIAYYAHLDGQTLSRYAVPYDATHKHDIESLAYLAAVSVLNGPPSAVVAVRFPQGTTVRSVHVDGSTAVVDLSNSIAQTAPGGFAESAEFKALVWTMTEIPGITRVRVRIAGTTLPTLPGGHFEIDEPLSRTDW